MSDIFDKQQDQGDVGEDKKTKERRASKFIREFMTKSREYRRPHLDLAVAARELYQCWLRDGRSPINRANLRLPYGFAIVQEQIPKIIEAVLQERPIFTVEGLEQQDLQWEDGITDYCDQQIDRMNFALKVIEYVTALLLDGTAIAKVPYRYEERIVKKRSYQLNNENEIELQKDESFKVKFDGPDLVPLAFIDFFPHWVAARPGDIQGMAGCAHRMWKSLSDLQSNPRYENLDEVETSMRVKGYGQDKAWGSPYWSEEMQAQYDRSNDNRPGLKTQDLVEVWEYWGIFDVSGKGDFEEYVITVANGDVVIRCEENPFDHQQKPFVASPNYVRDNEFYGIPELLVIRSQIKEAQALRNARLDQTNLSIYRMYVVDRAAGIKARSIYSRPNGIIWSNDVNGIRELPPADVSISAGQELQALQAEMKDTLGVSQGTGPVNPMQRNAARSATGVEWVNSIAASRAALKVRILSETFVKPLAQIMLQYDNQFVTDDVWARVSDPEAAAQNPFTVLPPSAFERAVDFMIKTPFETGGKQAELQSLQTLGQYLQTAEQTQPGITDWGKLFETVGRDLLGPKYKKFIRSDQERMQLQQQSLATEQAAQAAAGQRAPQPNASAAAPTAGPGPAMAPTGVAPHA